MSAPYAHRFTRPSMQYIAREARRLSRELERLDPVAGRLVIKATEDFRNALAAYLRKERKERGKR